MEVMEAIRERRSIRRYLPQPVSEETLATLFEAVQWAPSWANTQSWRLVVVRDPGLKDQLADSLRTTDSGRENPGTRAAREAPVALVACAQRGLSGIYRRGERQGQPATDKGEYWYMFDLALALQNLTLAAHALGLGTVHIGLFDMERVAQLFQVPPDVAVVEVMALGYPAENPSVRPRRPAEEFVSYDRYGVGLKVAG